MDATTSPLSPLNRSSANGGPRSAAPARLPSAPLGGGAASWLSGTTRRKAWRTYRARLGVQFFFAAVCLVLGWQFARFIDAARAGMSTLPTRPPGVEGFLPISGLMGALDWLYSGSLNRIHPAATVLLLTFVASAILLRKSFCSWICPVGLISDALARVGRRLFGRNFRPTIWVDVPLRSLKYVLLAFFLWFILPMHPVELKGFLTGPYNKLADVKMYLFFAHASGTALIVIGVFALLSIPIQGFWCRYLCPYGALLGLFSWASPVKIRRNVQSCTDCGICDRVCSARLPVSKSLAVANVECTGCLDCVASCPVRDTLVVGTPRRALSPLQFAAALLVLFAIGYGTARVTGHWHNGITPAEYRDLMPDVERIGHPGR